MDAAATAGKPSDEIEEGGLASSPAKEEVQGYRPKTEEGEESKLFWGGMELMRPQMCYKKIHKNVS